MSSPPRPKSMQAPRALAIAATLFVLAPSLASAGPVAPAPAPTPTVGKAPVGKTGIPDDSIKPVGKTGIPDDSIKPVGKVGTNDDSVKPVKPVGKVGTNDDSVKPVVGKGGVADDGVTPVKNPKALRARALKVLGRTHALLVRAHKAVIKIDSGKDDYRRARINYAAALTALNGGKPALAAKLALEARTYARKVLELGKQPISPQEATVQPDELATTEGVTVAELTTAAKAAEKSAPTNEELAKTEPAAPPPAEPPPAPPPSKPAPAPSTK